MSTPEKLKVLIINSENLEEIDAKDQNLRIRGITQSYFMFDAN